MRTGVASINDLFRNEQGLTLVELMIVLVLSMFLMGAVYMTFQVQKSTSDAQQEVAAVQQDLRAILDTLAKDLRMAGCDPTLNTNAGLTLCGPARMSFTMDLNENGTISGSDEQIAYVMTGTRLTRNGIELSNRVTGFTFTYLDGNDDPIAPAAPPNLSVPSESDLVRSVEVTIELRSQKRDPDLNDYIRRSMTRKIKMRNLGLI